MSNIYVSIEQISAIETHPNADRLEVAIILGTQTIVPKGEYHVGQKVVFFPPDILIPESCADSLGIKKYLKHALLDGIKQQCRVAACRIRGISSFGFIISITALAAILLKIISAAEFGTGCPFASIAPEKSAPQVT